MKRPRRNAPFKTFGKRALSGTESEAEGDIETWVDGLAEAIAVRTAHIALEHTTKGIVHGAVAFEEGGPACARVFNSAIKHLWASSCAYPARDPEACQVIASRAVGPNAGCGGGGVCVAAETMVK